MENHNLTKAKNDEFYPVLEQIIIEVLSFVII